MSRISFRPLTVFMQLTRKEICISLTFAIASSAGVTVPIPCPTDARPFLNHSDLQSKVITQPMELIKPRKPCTDHKGIIYIAQFPSPHNATECSTNLDFAHDNSLITFFNLIHKATWSKCFKKGAFQRFEHF